MQDQGYNYETSGFDSFLNRSIDATPQASLASSAPASNQVRFDSAQVSGLLGDTFQVGPIRLTKDGLFASDANGVDFLVITSNDG